MKRKVMSGSAVRGCSGRAAHGPGGARNQGNGVRAHRIPPGTGRHRWEPSDSSLNIDCSRSAQVHQDLDSVMRSWPVRLDHKEFVIQEASDGYPMYPTSLRGYQAIVEMANA